MKFFTKTLAASMCVAAFTFSAPQAFAETVTVTNLGEYYGAGPEVQVMRTPGGSFTPMNVGAFDVKISSASGPTYAKGDTLLAWCIDVADSFGTHVVGSYNVVVNATDSWVKSLNQLFAQFGTEVKNAVTSAAMQLAIWEVVGGDSTYNLAAGNFQAKASDGDGALAVTKAQDWLNWLNENPDAETKGYSLIKLENYGRDPKLQDLVTFVTPLPGAALLFLSALGLGGLARRKQGVQGPAAA